jgi:hypothetical protein
MAVVWCHHARRKKQALNTIEAKRDAGVWRHVARHTGKLHELYRVALKARPFGRRLAMGRRGEAPQAPPVEKQTPSPHAARRRDEF